MDQPPPRFTPPAPGRLFRSELPTPLSPVSSRVLLPLRSWPPLLAGPQHVHVPRSVSPNPSQSRTTRHRPTPALCPQGPAGSLHTPRPTWDVCSELILLTPSPTLTHPHALTHLHTHSPTCSHTHMHLDSHPHVCTLNPPSHTCSHTQAHTNTRSGDFTHFRTHKHTSDSCTCTLICTRSFRHKLTPAQPHSARPLHTHPHSLTRAHVLTFTTFTQTYRLRLLHAHSLSRTPTPTHGHAQQLLGARSGTFYDVPTCPLGPTAAVPAPQQQQPQEAGHGSPARGNTHLSARRRRHQALREHTLCGQDNTFREGPRPVWEGLRAPADLSLSQRRGPRASEPRTPAPRGSPNPPCFRPPANAPRGPAVPAGPCLGTGTTF